MTGVHREELRSSTDLEIAIRVRQNLRIGHFRKPLATRTIRPQRSMGLGEKCLQAQKTEANRSMGDASTLIEEARGMRIRGRFGSSNAHAEQRRSEFC